MKLLDCLAVLAFGLAGWSAGAAAQTCEAGIVPPAGWTDAAAPAMRAGMLQRTRVLRCTGCQPQLVAEIGAGAPSRPFSTRGLAWAQQGATSPIAREQLLGGMLGRMRASAPQCTVTGEVDGVTTAGDLAFLTTTVHQRCPPEQSETTVFNYSAYDGRCVYDVTVAWKGRADLAAGIRGRVHEVLSALTTGPATGR